MKKTLMLCTIPALILAGCANDGSVYRSDVYSASMVNQAQEVQTVEIIAVMPARIAVGNTSERSEGMNTGVILGALLGAATGLAVSNHSDAVIAGTVAGGALGGLAGRGASGKAQNLVDGVQITFKQNGKIFTSAQVGQLCEYKTGTAIMVSPTPNATRIQPNNPYGCQQQR
ncbi:MAG: hypothetical protein Q4E62_06155 [Sutterellaceae bacterium]|nr:hypothetical protein [Sutterellaceae bacterium]